MEGKILPSPKASRYVIPRGPYFSRHLFWPSFCLLAVWAPYVTKLHRPRRPGKTLYTDLIRKNPLWRIGFFIFSGRLRKYCNPDLMSVSKDKSFTGIHAICKLSVSLSKSDCCIYTMWHLCCPLIKFPLTVHVFCFFFSTGSCTSVFVLLGSNWHRHVAPQ